MANKYTRKGQKPPPVEDEFVSFWDHAFKVVEPHLQTVALALSGLLLVVALLWVYLYVRTDRRETATEKFARAVRIYEADLLPESDKDKPPEKPEGDEVPRFKTAKERAEATLAAIDTLEKHWGAQPVRERAQLFRAGVLYDMGRYDEAAAIDRNFADHVDAKSPVRPIAREGEGLVLEQKGQLDPALAIYKELAERGGDFYRDQALLDEARVLARKGDTAGAKDIYKKLAEKNPTGPLHETAQNQLGALGG